jgi:hypothetical protein
MPNLGLCSMCSDTKKERILTTIIHNGNAVEVCEYHARHPTNKVQVREVKEKKPKRIAPRSAKKIEADKVYSVKRADFLKQQPHCQIKRPGCKRTATQVHHSQGRIGSDYLDETTFIAVCDGDCHRWAEDHPNEAKLLGVSKSRLTKKK